MLAGLNADIPMATFPASGVLPATEKPAIFLPRMAAAVAFLLAAAGLLSIWPVLASLRDMWLHDDLKSIGMVIPFVSAILILRVWRSLGWEMRGTWWGFALLLLTVGVVRWRDHAILVFVAAPQWYVYLPPHSVVVVAYGSAMVLLFGGTRLFRAALFPILLLLLVNPVPHIFNVLIDLPLQYASAHVARSFAIALGQPLTPDQLKLMFTPEFGMFIAPGCNGIRGAVTMGLIALVAGYLYRFRTLAHAGFVAAAILLGYVFNFVRLCLLVLYYILALHVPRLQNHGEMADYYIGAALFLAGTLLLVEAMRRLRQVPSLTLQPMVAEAPEFAPASLYPRMLAMAAFVIVAAVPVAWGQLFPRPNPAMAHAAGAAFPARVGSYTLTRSWADTLPSGIVIYQWGEYASDAGGPHVSIGVSPALGAHDASICHSARGEDPLWHGELTLPVAVSGPVPFESSFFNDGATQYLEASTVCSGSQCGQFTSNLPRFGFVYSKTDARSVLTGGSDRPIPVLVRVETLDTTAAPAVVREELTATLRRFVARVDLDAFTGPYRL